jgi:anthranilate synthase
MHGKPSSITVRGGRLFEGLPASFVAGRYHSLHATRVPEALEVTAVAEFTKVVMAVQHRSLPIAAVQFHPESILSAENDSGLKILHNCMRQLTRA